MRYLYETELTPYLTQSKEDVLAYAETLVNSHNATSYQMANELSSMMRNSRRYDEATEIARMMFDENPTLERLNLYFVAATDQGDIALIQRLSALSDRFLKEQGVAYQKHLFATWLKAANKILDDNMFQYVYSQIPPEEKTGNSYIISQYYVYKNRHSQYEDVCRHYEGLEPRLQGAFYVKRYYENARRRLGYSVPSPMEVTRAVFPAAVTNPALSATAAPAAAEPAPEEKREKQIFLVYGGEPGELSVIQTLLKMSNIPLIVLASEDKTGLSIIEAFEKQASKAGLAVVLCTPEDELKNGKWYVRQNVVFECGYFMAKLGRQNVVLLRKDSGKQLEIPSDFSALYSISMDRGSWIMELGVALKQAGFSVPF